MPKRVSIYERSGTVYVVTSHQTQAGFWVDDEGVEVLPGAQPVDVGNAVEAALARSREGVPTPPPSADLSAPLLAAAGVASWNTFAKVAKYVGVRQNGDAIKVTPYRNLGGKDGFDPMQDKAISLPAGDTGLAATLVRALEIAE
ncbi:hypothetical protein [Sphingomonas sp. NIBR02145]|uniref:hypothetical protein n=1 Tax=Sphingomonas sp. NIBR02145 TaxID=3014784 RepID=UPI0022B45EA2|nr:hypothetical protein [Sphingomonas sp. NIBR02145]WHU05013.1 hypothetical protein O3305_10610 [Sphingomonas sp. NIBR02145]